MAEAEADLAAVTRLLGRAPAGAFEVVVRDDAGEPVVIRNAPLLDDGTPMPTRYWLVGADAARAVARLESAGGVRRAEAELSPELIAAAHAVYAAERDAALPEEWAGRAPPAAWAGRGRASSACTRTTPGSLPAVTTRSGGGRTSTWTRCNRECAGGRDRLRHQLDPPVDRRGWQDARAAHDHHAPRRASTPPGGSTLSPSTGRLPRCASTASSSTASAWRGFA